MGRNKCITAPIRRKTVIPALGEAHAKGYRRESKDLRWGTKSAINYVHLLITTISKFIQTQALRATLDNCITAIFYGIDHRCLVGAKHDRRQIIAEKINVRAKHSGRYL